MKRISFVALVLLLLTGCSMQTFETVDDLQDVQAVAQPATLLLDLPEDATTMHNGSSALYFCGDYDIMVEVLPSGNLSSTLQTLTGFEREDLNLLETVRCGVTCYEGAWSAAGEAGDHVGRVMVLDDGNYHYCISVMAMAENAGECTPEWNLLMESAALAEG